MAIVNSTQTHPKFLWCNVHHQGAKSHLAHSLNFVEFLHTLDMEFSDSIKKSLPVLAGGCYGLRVAAKSAIGCESLSHCMATSDANQSVFFYVVATAQLFNRILSMVALVGRRSRLPVSMQSGTLTPANGTTLSECESSGGDSLIYCMEIAIMATIPCPAFIWRFFSCQQANPVIHTVTAHTEREARSQLPSGRMVFTARIRQEANHA